MNRLFRTGLAALLALLVAGPAGAAEMRHDLPNGSTLDASDQDEVVTDRRALDEISAGSMGEVDPTLEAYWATPEFEVYLNHERIGYIQMDDWDDLDVDALWEGYVEGAREQSEQFGFEVKPLRWVVSPTLDRDQAVAYYALEVQFGDEPPLVNMVVFDFGRYGYEKMTMVQDSAVFPATGAAGIATNIAGAYAFGPESGYADFTEGDTIAAVGAGGLIAAALGVKFGKGILVVALLFLKKFWFLVLVIPAAIWKFLTGRGKGAEA